jgi:tetratricopeptide (TPR) repeat protein
MTGNAHHRISELIGSITAILVLCGISAFALQEKISPLSDFQYKRDYAQYEGIKKEADIQKRADLLKAFVKEHPISRILLYVATDYMECVRPLIEKKDWAKAIATEESFLALVPDDKTVQAAGIPVGVEEFMKEQLLPTRKLLLSSLIAANYQSNNFPKAAEAAEKVYAMAPDKSLLPVLADIYLKSQNADKYLEYGQKILAEYPIEQGYSTALQMAQIYIQKQDVKTATELLTKVMDVYGDKLPPNLQEATWNPTRAFAYGVIASGIYATKDYTKALEVYEKVAKFDPKREDAYYFIGMCKWQNKDPEGAIEAFAKSVVLNKTYSERARKYLEDLYKARHNDSLDGLDAVLAKAKSDLGVS